MTDTSYLLQYFVEHSPKEADAQKALPAEDRTLKTVEDSDGD